jgi:hypothetical protein
LLALALITVVFAAVAGAATAPASEPEPVVPSSGAVPEDDPSEAPPAPRRFVVMGPVVATREDRIAVMVPSRERPIIVAVHPATAVRFNTRKAELADIQRGDHALVVGRPGPRGNMIARAIVVVHKQPPPRTV